MAATLLLLVLSAAAYAQTSKSFIVGNVTDPDGAAVTGATVVITYSATGTTRRTVTQGDGSYRLDAVDPGTYKLEVSATGFKTWANGNVTVAAAQTVTIAPQLEVGTPSEVVTVSSGASVELQSADGTRAGTLDARQITDLPVVGLNPVNDITGQIIQPILRDGYDEVSILGSNYSAEYGRAGGAVVNVISKSGRNTLRGPSFSRLDLSLRKAMRVPRTETGRFEIRMDFFNVLNHPYFAWDHARADGDVLSQFFNQPRLNDGGQFSGSRGANRFGQIQLRFSF
jgi:hypothetical protein